MINSNDYLISKLAQHREAELQEKARIARLLADGRVEKPKFSDRFLTKSGELLIAFGYKLKVRYEPTGTARQNSSLELAPCEG